MEKRISFLRIALFLWLAFPVLVSAQVSINETNSDPDPSAMLDVQSTDKGMLIPRMNKADRDSISDPATGLMIYNTEDSTFHYFNGQFWQAISGPWIEKNGNVYTHQEKVGIGTANPTEKLSLEGGNFLQAASDPVHKGSLTDASGITALHHAWDLHIRGSYAYVISRDFDGLEILNIYDPTNPIRLSTFVDNGTTALQGAHSIEVVGQYAYIASYHDHGVEILDISNPSNPVHVGAIFDNGTTALQGATDIYVEGKYAYVVSNIEGGIEILDISDPSQPKHVGAIFDNGTTALQGAFSIAVVGKYAYVASDVDNGVEILDISDPSNPSHLGSITDNASTLLQGSRDIQVSGPYAYVVSNSEDGVEVLDISDPTNPIHVGAISDNGATALLSPWSIQVMGKYAYVTSEEEDGLEVLDISDPTNPIHAGAIFDDATTALNEPINVFVSGKYAYVTSSGDHGIEILDITGIQSPSADIGNIVTERLDVSDHAVVVNDLSVGGSIQVGVGGVLSHGDITTGGQMTMHAGAAAGLIPISDSVGKMSWETPNQANPLDNLGDHLSNQNLELNNHWLSGDGNNEGIWVNSIGKVGINVDNPQTELELTATVPEIRLTDSRAFASFNGYTLGKLSWYISDTQAPNDYGPAASITVMPKNPAGVIDGHMKFEVWNEGGGLPVLTPMMIDPDNYVSVTELRFPDGSRQSSTPAETGILMIAAGDFYPASQGYNYEMATGFSSGLGGTYMQSNDERLIAGVQLPHNSVITKITVYGYDLHSTNIRTRLIYSSFGSSNSSSIVNMTSSTSSGAYTQSQNVNHTVNNSQYHYTIFVELIGGTWHSAGQLAINGVKIEYNMP